MNPNNLVVVCPADVEYYLTVGADVVKIKHMNVINGTFGGIYG